MIIHTCEQNSDEWLALRAGMPTASCFSKLVTSTGAASKSMPEYAVTLAGELFAGKPLDGFEGSRWTERGHELEDAARAKYEFLHDVDAVQVGFITDDGESYGCSPDSIVGDDGLLEIKCLKAENHIKAIMYYQKHGKIPTTYAPQVQGQMYVTGRKWCDLCFYHPDLPMLVIRSEPIKAVYEMLNAQLQAVIVERDKINKQLESV